MNEYSSLTLFQIFNTNYLKIYRNDFINHIYTSNILRLINDISQRFTFIYCSSLRLLVSLSSGLSYFLKIIIKKRINPAIKS